MSKFLIRFLCQAPLLLLVFYALDQTSYGAWYISVPVVVILSVLYDYGAFMGFKERYE